MDSTTARERHDTDRYGIPSGFAHRNQPLSAGDEHRRRRIHRQGYRRQTPCFLQRIALHCRANSHVCGDRAGIHSLAARRGEHLRPAKNHRQIRRCDRRSGTYSDRAVHAFRPQVEPTEIRIFGPLREDRPSRKLGCIAVRYSLFAGILPLERGFLLRNVDPDGGSRTGRLVSACRICYCDRYAGGHRSLDTGLRRGRSGHLLRTNADNPKVARTHRRDAVYRCGYLLLDNIFFIKKSFVNAI